MRQILGLALLIGVTLGASSSCVSNSASALRERPLPYPFDHCAVNQKPFQEGGAKYFRIRDGYEVGFCCSPCVKAFEANPDPWMAPIREYYKDPEKVAAAKQRKRRKKYGSGD